MPGSTPQYDLIVVGLGIFGLSTCYHASKRGLRVLGLEQYDLLHDHGSSHGSTRVIRKAYYEHPDYVSLLNRAYEGWHEWEAQSPTPLMNLCGTLTAAPRGDELIRGVLLSNEQHGLGCEELSAEEANARFPAFSFPSNWTCVFEPTGGFLYADRAREVIVDLARANGAELIDCQHMSGWREEGEWIVVQTEETAYEAKAVVLTAGPWMKPILGQCGVELTLVRKMNYWYLPVNDAITTPDKMPVFLAQDDSGLYYGLPAIENTPEDGVRVCRHDDNEAIRAAALMSSGEEMLVAPFVSEQESVERPAVEAFAREKLRPALLGEGSEQLVLCDSSVCQYTLSPDQHFILGRHPASSRVALAAGFSGHGFKFAPVIGEILVDLAMGKDLDADAAFLGIDRFNRRR